MENRKKALGRGLEQLFNNENLDLEALEKNIYESATKEEVVDINLEDLRPNPYQPRKIFKDEALEDLAASIKEHGVFQPIIAKKSIKGYEIIAGERRLRASKMAGLKTIPAIIRNFTDEQMIEIALLENLQRENLNVIEEANAYRTMLESLGITQEEVAKKVGKSRSHVTNILGLLRLPKEVQDMVLDDKLSMGHARVLSKLESDDQIINMAKDIVNNKTTVRDVEEITENAKKTNSIKRKAEDAHNDYKYVEELLKEKLDTRVKIKNQQIEIKFTNVADLNRILEILNIKE